MCGSKSQNSFKNRTSLSSGLIYREDKVNFKRLEILGVLFVFFAATLLHFSYELSHGSMWSILVGAVNESVWEHIKIFILPYVIWSIIELSLLNLPFRNFVVAKTFGLLSLIFTIIVLFYSYTHFTQNSILTVDITISIVSIIIANIISYYLTSRNKDLSKWYDLSILIIFILFLFYITFTFFPPQINLFQDPITGTYGIPKKTLSHYNYTNARNV